jgi:hypothetical protein
MRHQRTAPRSGYNRPRPLTYLRRLNRISDERGNRVGGERVCVAHAPVTRHNRWSRTVEENRPRWNRTRREQVTPVGTPSAAEGRAGVPENPSNAACDAAYHVAAS